MTHWFDKIKFKNILAIIESDKFNYKNKIGEFKYNDIKYFVSKIRNNTISKIFGKKGLNTLYEIKNAEIIKHKKCTPKQKELLNLFNDLLGTILTDKILKLESQKDNTLMSSKDENVNDETLMSSKDDDDDDDDDDDGDENGNENEDDDETINQNSSHKIKELNDHLNEITDKSKSFEEQMKLLKKLEDLKWNWPYEDFGDKELKSKYFQMKLADMPNDIDEKLFEQIFSHTLEALANKLINTTNK